MKTVLFTTTFLEGVTFHGCSRLERTQKWFRYYLQPEVMDSLGFDEIICTDNASPIELLKELDALVIDSDGGHEVDPIVNGNPRIKIYRHSKRLAKEHPEIAFGCVYPFVWRGLWDLKNLAENLAADKFLRIDNDAYVLSRRLAAFIKNQNSGFIALGGPPVGIEDAIMVLNKNAFPNLIAFCGDDNYLKYAGKVFESELPLTGVARQFVGARFGEENPPRKQEVGQDYYCQSRLRTEMKFEST